MADQMRFFDLGPIDQEEDAKRIRAAKRKAKVVPEAESDVCGVFQPINRSAPGGIVLKNVRHEIDRATVVGKPLSSLLVLAAAASVVSEEGVETPDDLIDVARLKELRDAMKVPEKVPEHLKTLFFAGDPQLRQYDFQQMQPFCQAVLAASGGDVEQAQELVRDLRRLAELIEKQSTSVEAFQTAVDHGFHPALLQGDWTDGGFERQLIRMANGMMKKWKELEPYWRRRSPIVKKDWDFLKPVRRRHRPQDGARSRLVHPKKKPAQRDFVGTVLSDWNAGLLRYEHITALPDKLQKQIVKGMSSTVKPAYMELDGKSLAAGAGTRAAS